MVTPISRLAKREMAQAAGEYNLEPAVTNDRRKPCLLKTVS